MMTRAAVDQALKRLLDALDSLDAAMELRLDSERRRGSLAEQVQAFSLDRARLASELDGAQARARALATANREAAHRLDEAMTTVRAIIMSNERPEAR
jgi:hypothetical protein